MMDAAGRAVARLNDAASKVFHYVRIMNSAGKTVCNIYKFVIDLCCVYCVAFWGRAFQGRLILWFVYTHRRLI
jgi:hypothetical protein